MIQINQSKLVLPSPLVVTLVELWPGPLFGGVPRRAELRSCRPVWADEAPPEEGAPPPVSCARVNSSKFVLGRNRVVYGVSQILVTIASEMDTVCGR
jgi:hypothetical protein